MTSLLTVADLTMMRDTIEGLLPDTCNILSETLLQDGQGGVTSSWGTVSGTVACRLDDLARASSGLILEGGGQRSTHQYQLSLIYSATINAGDIVELNSSAYRVMSVNTNQSWEAVKRAIVELTDSAPGTVNPPPYYTIGTSPIA